MRIRDLLAAAVLLGAMLTSASPVAAQSGDWYARWSLGTLSLNETSDVVAGTGSALDLESSTPQLRFDIGRHIALDLALEGSLAIARTDLAAADGPHDGVSAGQAWSTTGTFLLVWRLPIYGDVRPYLAGGIGLTALPYYIRDNGARSLGIRELETGLGVGPVAAVGVDYEPSGAWLVSLEARWLDAPLDLDVVNDAGDTVDTVEMPFAPVTVSLGVGWRF